MLCSSDWENEEANQEPFLSIQLYLHNISTILLSQQAKEQMRKKSQ